MQLRTVFAALFALSTAVAAWGQQVTQIPDCFTGFAMNASGQSGAVFDNRSVGCTFWTVTYLNDGFATVTLTVQSASDSGGAPGPWAAFVGTVLTGLNPNTSITNAYSILGGYNPWVRVSLSSTGAGLVRGTLYGYKAGTGGALASCPSPCPVVGTAATGAAPVGNPVQVGGSDGAAMRPMKVAPDGSVEVQGPAADGAAGGNPLGMGVYDALGNARVLRAASAATDGDSGSRTGLIAQQTWNGATYDRNFACIHQAPITASGAGYTEIVAASGTTVVRVCHVSFAAATPVNIKFGQGTGANCATGTADITGVYQNVSSFAVDFSPTASLRTTAAGQALCINLAVGVAVGGVVIYAQY